MSIPAPTAQRFVGHLGRWGTRPLELLDEGATLGPIFSLWLWRRAIVGYSPAWNRLVLGDLHTFRSRGSMSGLTPYLAGGLVQTDAPSHRARRQVLNPPFHRTALTGLTSRIRAVTERRLPEGTFDAAEWASQVTRDLLLDVFFGGAFPEPLLHAFLAPLDKALPAPFVRRPWLFRRMNAAIDRAMSEPQPDTLIDIFAGLDNGLEEARVALSAAYDTTAHTLAWLLWHLGDHPHRQHAEMLPHVVEETLRLYPAGWVGSRICTRDVELDGITVPSGRLVLYSPYLTHRDPSLWSQPLEFRPERFADPLPAWGFIPFAAGERTCLGMHLARLVLRTVAAEFATRPLTRLGADPGLRAGVTLAPAGPLLLHRGGGLAGDRPAASTDVCDERAD